MGPGGTAQFLAAPQQPIFAMMGGGAGGSFGVYGQGEMVPTEHDGAMGGGVVGGDDRMMMLQMVHQQSQNQPQHPSSQPQEESIVDSFM
jgi:hypothetical protein